MTFASGPYTISIGGGALLAGGRLTVTLTVPGARSGMQVKVNPQTDPGAGYTYGAWVSSNDTVTMWVMAILALTPPSVTYNITVEQ